MALWTLPPKVGPMRRHLRRAAPVGYVLVLGVTAYFTDGRYVGAVAALGAMAVGLSYVLLRDPPGDACE